jgi:hypothetical protein
LFQRGRNARISKFSDSANALEGRLSALSHKVGAGVLSFLLSLRGS